MSVLTSAVAADASPRPRSARRHPLAAPGVVVPAFLVLLIVVAAAAPNVFAHTGPNAVDTSAVFQAPSAAHWFGTDQLGRDVYSRVVHGAAYSIGIGLGATLIAFALGTVVGLAAALAPGGVDRVVVRVLDVLLAFPDLLLALLVIAVLGRGPVNTLVAVGLAGVASYARLIRSQVLQVRRSGYVEHARALGESPARILVTSIVPNTIRPLLVLATIGVGSSILSASALSFLGLGVVPPAPEWGALLADGRSYLAIAPWVALLPATVVSVAVIAITLLGRRLQAAVARGTAS